MNNRKKLADRWSSQQLKDANEGLASAVKGRRAAPASPFGSTPGGLMDYRGLSLTVLLTRFKLDRVDFSYATSEWAGALNDCQSSDSAWIGADFDGRFFGKRFERCDFGRITLTNSALGDSRFVDCSFVGANFSDAMARGAVFVRCAFDSASLKRATFTFCSFEDCSFEKTKFHNGSLAGCKFVGSRPDAQQLGNTML